MDSTARLRGRKRRHSTDSALQYSLFGSDVAVSSAEAHHYRRQAALCERLLASLHQPELIEALDRLHHEYAEAAERLESGKEAASGSAEAPAPARRVRSKPATSNAAERLAVAP